MHLRHTSLDIFDMHTREQQNASREAKKYILSKERNDWEWPPQAQPQSQPPSSSGSSGPSLLSSSAPGVVVPNALAPSIRPHALVGVTLAGWRERYYGSSDDEDGTHDDAPASTTNVAGQGQEERVDSAQDASGEWKFESPDSVGCAVEQRSVKRKRRRKAKLEEELWWNEGLRCFVERRNAWTSARKREDREQSALVLLESESMAITRRGAGVEEMEGAGGGDVQIHTGTSQISLENTHPERKDGEERDDESTQTGAKDQDLLKPPATLTSRPSSRGRGGKRVATPASLPGPIPDSDPLIPIPPPLFDSTNTLRAAIQPKAYANIYTQIVQSTRTPAIPILLADMTRALVAGWKDAGEWPPKTIPQDSPVMPRRRTINGREETIGKLLHEERAAAVGRRKSDYKGDDGIGGHGISIPPGVSIGEGLLSNHNHLRRGVEGVKRVLRLSGSHDKGSSHGSEYGEGDSHGTEAAI